MTRVRRGLANARAAMASPVRSALAWQAEIPAEGRVVLVGLGLIAVSLAAWALPLAGLVPGLVLVAVGVGVNFRHPATSAALVVAVAAVAITALVTA